MALIACPACDHRISEQAVACPSCGHPGPRSDRRGVVAPLGHILGQVAGTYISAQALTGLVLGGIMFTGTAAVLITLILTQR